VCCAITGRFGLYLTGTDKGGDYHVLEESAAEAAEKGQPVAAGAPDGSIMQVQVPMGASSGQLIQIQTPGGMVQVQVPHGLSPGQTFRFQAPQMMPASATKPAETPPAHPSFALTHFHAKYEALPASEYKEQHQIMGAVHRIVIHHQRRNRVHITEEQATEFFTQLQDDAMKRETHDGMLEVVHDVPATSQRMWTR
jgi:hypothetical protein